MTVVLSPSSTHFNQMTGLKQDLTRPRATRARPSRQAHSRSCPPSLSGTEQRCPTGPLENSKCPSRWGQEHLKSTPLGKQSGPSSPRPRSGNMLRTRLLAPPPPFHLRPYVGRFHNENGGKTFLWKAIRQRREPGQRLAGRQPPGSCEGRQRPPHAPALQSGPRKAGESPQPTPPPSAWTRIHAPGPSSVPSFRP